jgi:hypothetical protein
MVCVSVFADLSSTRNTKFNFETHFAIGQNICAAANKQEMDPRILGAYILTENAKFDPFEAKDAAMGKDRGLYQSNSHYQGNRANYEFVAHPFYATEIAAQIIKENMKKYADSWKAIAAYWNPKLAEAEDSRAIEYYNRWRKNFEFVQARFTEKARILKSNEVVQ